MSNAPDAITATLTFADHVAIDFQALERDLGRVFSNVGLDLPYSESVSRRHTTFVGDQLSLRIARISGGLALWVEDGTERDSACADTRLKACFHTMRHLSSVNDLATIGWHHTGQSYTFEEFAHRVVNDPDSMAGPAVNDRIAPSSQSQTGPLVGDTPTHHEIARRTERSILFDKATLDVRLMHDKLDRCMEKIMNSDHPVSHKETRAPSDAAPLPEVRKIRPHDTLRQSAPIWETENRLFRDALYPSGQPDFDSSEEHVLFGPAHASDVAEKEEVSARFAVYALNGVLLLTAMPVGLAMATYNMLGGENFRLTAQMVALTGMFTGLAATGTLESVSHLW